MPRVRVGRGPAERLAGGSPGDPGGGGQDRVSWKDPREAGGHRQARRERPGAGKRTVWPPPPSASLGVPRQTPSPETAAVLRKGRCQEPRRKCHHTSH